MANEKQLHVPVLAREVVELLICEEEGIYVDGTLGAGGHAKAILRKLGSDGLLIGIDRDEEALSAARKGLEPWKEKCSFVHGNFSEVDALCKRLGVVEIDGLLLDLGVSSLQLDGAERGFSFMKDGLLDMRMDSSQRLTAADLVRSLSSRELRSLLKEFGEERFAAKIAAAMARESRKRGELSTSWLADLVCRVTGKRAGRIHPATRTFQALRMAVNDESANLQAGLERGLSLLKVGGRMAVISYHSIEDRRVKQVFSAHVGKEQSLHAGGRQWVGLQPRLGWVVRKPSVPSKSEINENPRARSAKLRVVERIR